MLHKTFWNLQTSVQEREDKSGVEKITVESFVFRERQGRTKRSCSSGGLFEAPPPNS